ncbi:MAG: iron ABC transporter permease [Oligoflexia bacterium]|nr:iron ABC transporter permease [Oligoflexia bacterium]
MKRALLFLCAIIGLLVSPMLGAQSIPFAALWDWSDPVSHQILFDMRFPRVVLAALAGAALSAGGLVFQGVFQNPLACPYTLGVSTGAAFGAALALRAGSLGIASLGVTCCSFLGALFTVTFVALLGRRQSSVGMLLAGVVVSLFFSSLIVLLQYLSDYEGLFRIVRWLMGGLETVGWEACAQVAPFVVVGLGIVFVLARDLDNLMLGDELAASRGIDVSTSRALLFLATSAMVGGVVSVCGPIGFVGIMVPHICRLLVGGTSRALLCWNVLLGAGFLAFCDALGRVALSPFEIPVGVITALLGGPFFLILLLRRQGW